jgi:hypothetical protein
MGVASDTGAPPDGDYSAPYAITIIRKHWHVLVRAPRLSCLSTGSCSGSFKLPLARVRVGDNEP